MSSNFQVGPRHRFRRQEFWAEGGMVCLENVDNGDFRAITRAEAAARAIALNEELRFIEYPSERDELSRCIQNLCEVVKEAKRQGDPTNPAVRRDRIKSLRKPALITGPSSDGGVILDGSISKRFRSLSI